jgi:glycosyltransferase involved in cell wall biosynthesis
VAPESGSSAGGSDPAIHALYISYDGALDPLGQSQVVPYLEALAARGVRYDLITFEKPERASDPGAVEGMRARLEASGIAWHPLPYTKHPPVLSTARDLRAGWAVAADLQDRDPFDLVHARSYPSALLASRLKGRSGTPFIFDMRGFYAEERLDGGIWGPTHPAYRVTKRVERDLLREADAVVTLTRASVPILRDWIRSAGGRADPTVLPTCVDLHRFAPPRTDAPAEDRGADRGSGLDLVYLGSIGTWYLLDDMLDLAEVGIGTGDVRSVSFVVNQGDEEIRAGWMARGLDPEALRVGSVSHDDVPGALAGASGLFYFIRPAFSKISSSATKLGEALALGLPVLTNAGVGDQAEIIRRHRVGVVVEEITRDTLRAALVEFRALVEDPGVRERCVRAAREEFRAEICVERYWELYRTVAGGDGSRSHD